MPRCLLEIRIYGTMHVTARRISRVFRLRTLTGGNARTIIQREIKTACSICAPAVCGSAIRCRLHREAMLLADAKPAHAIRPYRQVQLG